MSEESKQELVDNLLNLVFEAYPEELKEWIYNQWPHGIGLYD